MDEEATAAAVVRAQRGDAAAREALARQFLRPAYVLALAIVARPADAEDVAQDAIVQALGHLETCREPRRFAAWLMQIVRNRARNWLDWRRLHDVEGARGDVVATGGVPVAARVGPLEPAAIGLRERLLVALEGLTPAQREVVLLHDLEEWTHAEIADLLGCSEVMSRQHLFTARRVLRARLDAERKAEVGHG